MTTLTSDEQRRSFADQDDEKCGKVITFFLTDELSNLEIMVRIREYQTFQLVFDSKEIGDIFGFVSQPLPQSDVLPAPTTRIRRTSSSPPESTYKNTSNPNLYTRRSNSNPSNLTILHTIPFSSVIAAAQLLLPSPANNPRRFSSTSAVFVVNLRSSDDVNIGRWSPNFYALSFNGIDISERQTPSEINLRSGDRIMVCRKQRFSDD